MSLLFKIKQKLPTLEVEALHRLFLATVQYHVSDISVKEAHASFSACYKFDTEFTAASYRIWTGSRYTMVNIKYFVLWLSQHPRTPFRKSMEVAKAYGVSRMDALMIRSHLDLSKVKSVDSSIISVAEMRKALSYFDTILPDLVLALQKQVGKNCQWLRRSTNMTINDMVSDILGDVIPVYYRLVPTTKKPDHILNHMYAAVSSRVKNYLNMHSSTKRKRSIAVYHSDGSVDYTYLESNETHMTAHRGQDDGGSLYEGVLAIDENEEQRSLDTERELSIRSLIRKAPSKCRSLYKLVFGKPVLDFDRYLETNRLAKREMTTTEWILSVPFHKFVRVYSEFANMPEEGIHNSLAQLKGEVF